jgi:glutathione synthase/RimK-type ligase-like ATP-grasp enzyme
MNSDVALVTERRYAAAEAAAGDWYLGNILREDRLLAEALAELGLSSVRVAWSDPECDWCGFRVTVLRTAWDYFDRFAEFCGWLERVERQTRLCNPPATLRWNMDKHYLADLEAAGVAIVPTRFVERGSPFAVQDYLDEFGWSEAVVKPCVSGGARHTYRATRENAAQVDALVRPVLAAEAMLVQPFVRSVLENGEDTLVAFDGRTTHAVRKTAKPGDFRVQDDHGGTVRRYEPSQAQVELAVQALGAVSPRPAYGRVDMVQLDDGRHAVMELELVEPELWMRLHEPSAKAFAAAIAAEL